MSRKVRRLNWAGKNVESLAHVEGKFPPPLSWMYKSNTFPHISLLNVSCWVDSGKCFLVAEQLEWLYMSGSVLEWCPARRGCEGGSPEVQLHWHCTQGAGSLCVWAEHQKVL